MPLTGVSIVECEQRSPEWFLCRAGRVTSSRVKDMLASVQKGEAAGRKNLRAQLMLERITGRCMEKNAGWQSDAMKTGSERESFAAALYEAERGVILQHTGFLKHDTLQVGASLDGHLGDFDGIVEIKSPEPATHLEYLTTGAVPDAYHKQITHQLFVCGAQWCDFISYHPDFPEKLRLKVVRVPRDEQQIAAHALALQLFLREVETQLDKLQALLQAA